MKSFDASTLASARRLAASMSANQIEHRMFTGVSRPGSSDAGYESTFAAGASAHGAAVEGGDIAGASLTDAQALS